MKKIIVLGLVLGSVIAIAGGCAVDPCPGQQACPDGTCTDVGRVCCGGGLSCPGGTTCGPNDTCVSPYVNNAAAQCNACVSEGLECCPNALTDQVDCMGVGRTCCFDGLSCPGNTTCLSNGTCS